MTDPRIRLDGRTRLSEAAEAAGGWPTLWQSDVDAAPGGPVSLSPLCSDGTPARGSERLCLAAPDGTMGSLRLPPWLAVTRDARVLLLHQGAVLRLGPTGFRPLVLPRSAPAPRAIHATSVLYMVGLREVLVFDSELTVIAHITGTPEIIDSTVKGDSLLLLQDIGLSRLPPGAFAPEPLPPLPADHRYRSVVAMTDGARALLLADGRALRVDARNQPVGLVTSAAELSGLVNPPILRLDGAGRFAVPAQMLSDCPEIPTTPPLEDPLAAARDGGILFGRDGDEIPPDPRILATAPVFAKSGWWIGMRLNGGRDGQVWRHGRIAFDALPPGTAVELSAFSSDDPTGLPDDLRPEDHAGFFRRAFLHREPAQRPLGRTEPTGLDFHLSVPPGRYLWVRLGLRGDGRRTPRIASVDLTYGGDRWLEKLPAEFQRQEPTRDHLERLLGLLTTATDDIQTVIERSGLLADPRFTNSAMVDIIGQLLGIAPDPRLTETAQRRILWLQMQSRAAPGTRARLRDRLKALLATLSDLPAEQIDVWPRIIEGFETRDSLQLGQGGSRLGARAGLALSSGITLGQDVLDSRTDPAIADFQRTAHRIEVVLPLALAPGEAAQNMIRRAIADEVPGHVVVTLTRVPSGVRLGGTPRLGIDTILRDPRPIRLRRGACGPDTNQTTATGPRLGMDATLARGRTAASAIQLDSQHGGLGRLL